MGVFVSSSTNVLATHSLFAVPASTGRHYIRRAALPENKISGPRSRTSFRPSPTQPPEILSSAFCRSRNSCGFPALSTYHTATSRLSLRGVPFVQLRLDDASQNLFGRGGANSLTRSGRLVGGCRASGRPHPLRQEDKRDPWHHTEPTESETKRRREKSIMRTATKASASGVPRR